MAVPADRAPPELEPGVTLDSLVTIEDCDAALDRLMLAIPSIEEQLARIAKNSPNQPAGWRVRTEKALRIKKMLLPRLQQRRAEFARRLKEDQHAANVQESRMARLTKERVLLSIAREIAPDLMTRIHEVAVDRHPDLFGPEREAV